MFDFQLGGWQHYIAHSGVKPHPNAGKWCVYFYGQDYARQVCERAIEEGVTQACKHNAADSGMLIFFAEMTDRAAVKRIAQWLIDNDLIRKTGKGKLYNIAFKSDEQTAAGEYGKNFEAEIKLGDLFDLTTGKPL
ncbi:hypothetical protein ACVOZ6_004698 [Escherichia coli]